MKHVTLFAAICSVLYAAPLLGAGDADAAKSIVVQHCVKCHAVPGYNPTGGPESIEALPLETIAKNPAVYTPQRLREFLRRPHYPMQGMVLSGSDIENLIAFIDSLRE